MTQARPTALPPDDADGAGLAARVRRAERRLGIYRPGRSPWVWILGPGVNAVITTAVVLWLAHGDLGWLITVPLAIVSGLAMGAMAWAFMGTSWDQEQDERAAAELYAARRRAAEPAHGLDRPAIERTAAVRMRSSMVPSSRLTKAPIDPYIWPDDPRW